MPRTSIVFCYAREDRSAADRLAAFLKTNCDCEVSLDEAVIGRDFDLMDASERALSAEAAIVLLSPHSVPKQWVRARWEPVFFPKPEDALTRIGFALLGNCRFPELFRRGAFFDLSADFPQGCREARHWVARAEGRAAQTAGVPHLRESICDRPGSARLSSEAAGALMKDYAADFEGVHRVACGSRSDAGVLGDLGQSIGLPLTGTAEQNRETLARQCSLHRWLLVLENLAPERQALFEFGGRASCIFVEDADVTKAPVEDVAARFLCFPRQDELCAPLIGVATLQTFELLKTCYDSGLRLGWGVIAVLKSLGRFAEMVEMLKEMETAARSHRDDLALYKIEWEQNWVSEESDTWGIRILPTAGDDTRQLGLFDLAG